MKLYYMTGSQHCEAARTLLKNSRLAYEEVDASDRYVLASLYRDFEIDELPVLIDGRNFYVGLSRIGEFIERNQKMVDTMEMPYEYDLQDDAALP